MILKKTFGIARHSINTFKKPEIESISFMQRTVGLAVGMKAMIILNRKILLTQHEARWRAIQEKEN